MGLLDDMFAEDQTEKKPYNLDEILMHHLGVTKDDLINHYTEMDSLITEFRGPANEVVDFSKHFGEAFGKKSHEGNLFDTSRIGSSGYSEEYLQWIEDNNLKKSEWSTGDPRSHYYSNLFDSSKDKLLQKHKLNTGAMTSISFQDPFVDTINKYWYRPLKGNQVSSPVMLYDAPYGVCKEGDPLGICDGNILSPYKLAVHLINWVDERKINPFEESPFGNTQIIDGKIVETPTPKWESNFEGKDAEDKLKAFGLTYGGGANTPYQTSSSSRGLGTNVLFQELNPENKNITDSIIDYLHDFHNIDLFKE